VIVSLYRITGPVARSAGRFDDVTPAHSDPDLARLAVLPVSVLADVLDRLGHREQALDHRIRPIDPGRASLAGRAFTIAAVASDEILQNPYQRELEAVDATPAGAIVVLATGRRADVAVWGELLTTRMLARGGVGAVTDGGIRDIAGIRRLGVPSFAAGISPRDSMGRMLVTGYGDPVTCGGVEVSTGDLVRGDEDGLVVVPKELAARALDAGEEKLVLERLVREGLGRGETAADLYDRYGVL
jgi:4-hydroxy-4-methyl-2-oxoglutarate aldolase